jgi:glycerol-1-phosphate dehydrogenase [NAD(P)+]
MEINAIDNNNELDRLNHLASIFSDVVIVTDECVYDNIFPRVINAIPFNIINIISSLNQLDGARWSDFNGAILAIGGGSVIDEAKRVAHTLNRPYLIIPTRISPAIFTSLASFLQNGKVINMITSLPHSLLLSYDILDEVGSKIANFDYVDAWSFKTAFFDVILDYRDNGKPFNPNVIPILNWCANELCRATSLQKHDYYDLMISVGNALGHITNTEGGSRYVSGAEHLFCHSFTHANKRYSHGLAVGIGMKISTYLQERCHDYEEIKESFGLNFDGYLAAIDFNKIELCPCANYIDEHKVLDSLILGRQIRHVPRYTILDRYTNEELSVAINDYYHEFGKV